MDKLVTIPRLSAFEVPAFMPLVAALKHVLHMMTMHVDMRMR